MSARTSFPALGTTAVVVVPDERALRHARRILVEELDRVDRACSRFRADSELANANARAGEAVHVTAFFAEHLRVALEAAESTDGLVTPTLGTALRAAGYDRTFSLVRARGSWASVRIDPHPDAWREIELDHRRRELRVPVGVELDLGATAKALAADHAAARMTAETSTGALVSLGGDVAVAGPAPAGGWPVLVADDHTLPLDAAGQVIGIAAGGLATSSTTVRSWPVDGGTAHHVLDPRTARPADTPWRTVSVAAASCLEANIAATGALVAAGDAPAWLARRGVHARLVAHGGDVSHVGAWPRAVEAA